MELKLVADVGIVGAPNAGKSTFLSAITAAQPEIANYPFTTLLPNLGVVSLDFDATMVVADLPGLLEGAHRGYGLGHEFLRHSERCSVLVSLILEIFNKERFNACFPGLGTFMYPVKCQVLLSGTSTYMVVMCFC